MSTRYGFTFIYLFYRIDTWYSFSLDILHFHGTNSISLFSGIKNGAHIRVEVFPGQGASIIGIIY